MRAPVDHGEHRLLAQQSQAQIDEEILARYLPVCALRTKRNALSPISRLPDDLLASVFILCVRRHHIFEWAKVRLFAAAAIPPRVPIWVGVSYVCRRWRTVALDCPTLWTYPFVVSRTWMTELLRRSQMAPLRVRIDLTYMHRRLVPMLEMVLEHLPRVEELRIRALPADMVRSTISKLQAPAPILQSLQLSVSTNRRPLATLDDPPPDDSVLFSRSTPKLRSLDLWRIDIAWHSLTLVGITSLRLLSVPRPHSMQQLCSILSQMPDLKNLELGDVLPWQDSVVEEATALPYLSRLTIAATIPNVVSFLSHVDIPLDTEIRLRCVLAGGASFYRLLSYIQRKLKASKDGKEGSMPKPVRAISLGGFPPQTFFVTCSTSEGGHTYDPLSPSENFDFSRVAPPLNYDWDRGIPLKMEMSDFDAFTDTVMVNVFQHLCLTHLSSLAVHFPERADLSGMFWEGLFDVARELRFIKLKGTSLRSFVTTLSPDHHGRRGRNETLVACALEEIELDHVVFSAECNAEEAQTHTCDPTLQCLCDALSRRRDAGHSLRSITILDSANVGTDKQVDELLGVVREVHWDRISKEYPTEDPEFLDPQP